MHFLVFIDALLKWGPTCTNISYNELDYHNNLSHSMVNSWSEMGAKIMSTLHVERCEEKDKGAFFNYLGFLLR